MPTLSLDALAREHLGRAKEASTGRSAETVYRGDGQILRQTLIALSAGSALAEHESPGDATAYVLSGRVQLGAGGDSWEGHEGDLIAIPPSRHHLLALEDAVVLLTVGMVGS